MHRRGGCGERGREAERLPAGRGSRRHRGRDGRVPERGGRGERGSEAERLPAGHGQGRLRGQRGRVSDGGWRSERGCEAEWLPAAGHGWRQHPGQGRRVPDGKGRGECGSEEERLPCGRCCERRDRARQHRIRDRQGRDSEAERRDAGEGAGDDQEASCDEPLPSGRPHGQQGERGAQHRPERPTREGGRGVDEQEGHRACALRGDGLRFGQADCDERHGCGSRVEPPRGVPHRRGGEEGRHEGCGAEEGRAGEGGAGEGGEEG